MIDYPTTPLQQNRDCVAYAFAHAIEVALTTEGQEYWQRIDRNKIVEIVGAPAHAPTAAKKLKLVYPWLGLVVMETPAAFPCVATTWRDGFSHAVTLVSHGTEYDPALGKLVATRGGDKMSGYIHVMALAAPLICKWRKYAWYRWLERVGVLDDTPHSPRY